MATREASNKFLSGNKLMSREHKVLDASQKVLSGGNKVLNPKVLDGKTKVLDKNPKVLKSKLKFTLKTAVYLVTLGLAFNPGNEVMDNSNKVCRVKTMNGYMEKADLSYMYNQRF
jgi:hypothetical protein